MFDIFSGGSWNNYNMNYTSLVLFGPPQHNRQGGRSRLSTDDSYLLGNSLSQYLIQNQEEDADVEESNSSSLQVQLPTMNSSRNNSKSNTNTEIEDKLHKLIIEKEKEKEFSLRMHLW